MFSRRLTSLCAPCFESRSGWLLASGLLTALLAAALPLVPLVSHGGEVVPAVAPSAAPLFTRTEAAENPSALRLLVDRRKVLGWISGAGERAGEEVLIRHGDRIESVAVQTGNTFTWHFAFDADTEVEFQVGEHSESVTLGPPPATPPTAFFVVDRPVYRPGQKLQFVAFLRQLDDGAPDGDRFRPLPGRSVEVELRSSRKKTLVARLPLVADDSGRIAGEYCFVDADPHDDYTLAIDGYAGSGRVALAEFRKSKVKLEVAGELIDGDPSGGLADRRLRLTFSAVDFLDEPVSNAKVRFEAMVVSPADRESASSPGSFSLDGGSFVHASKEAGVLESLARLDENEALLLESGEGLLPEALHRGPAIFARFGDDLALGSGRAETTLDIEAEWIERGYAVSVRGILVDENGREERAFETFPLAAERPSRIRLALPKRPFGAGESIPVEVDVEDESGRPVDATTTLVLMKLASRFASPGYGYYGYLPYGYNGLGGGAGWNASYAWGGHHRAGRRHLPGGTTAWRRGAEPGRVEREIATALPLACGRGTLAIDEPGAYEIRAIARLPGGEQLEDGASCLVLPREAVPQVVLRLDRTRYRPGERVTGAVHSRLEDARLLLTVRDASGMRLWRTLRTRGAVTPLSVPLPAELDFGAVVAVEYVAADGVVHYDAEAIEVPPEHRMIEISTQVPDIAEPGETVAIEVEVDRSEEVDLVVSVYDQSLLGIAPDRAVDIRDFYLADDRSREGMAKELLERKLRGVALEELVERARRLLEEDPSLESAQDGLLTRLVSRTASRHLDATDARTLLWLAGVHCEVIARGSWHVRLDAERASHPVLDLLDATRDGWRLTYGLFRDVLIVTERHSGQEDGTLYRAAHFAYLPFEPLLDWSARGDAHYSVGGNGSFSYLPSGQSFISHLAPAAGPAGADGAGPERAGGTIRRDFSDSAFFAGRLRTDQSGRATVRFRLPDSLTNWRVVVTAIDRHTCVGHSGASFRTSKPVMVWPMLPRTFTQGDRVELYASVHNRTSEDRMMTVSIDTRGGEVHGPREQTVLVKAGSHRPVYWTFEPRAAGFCEILMSARCDAGSDRSLKRLPVERCSVEEVVTASGFAEGTARFRIPAGIDLQESSLEITLSPTLAADVFDTLEYLVTYPHGCVEQTMSRFLPLLEVAKILQLHGLSRPELEEKLPGHVAAGIKRLLELQLQDGGWGWIGSSETHEMMTPWALYGLIRAEDSGYEIGGADAIRRGLDRLRQFIQSMGEPQAADRVYCMYVYSLRHELRDEWWVWIEDLLHRDRLTDYATALALEMAVRASEREALADRLAEALEGRAKNAGGRVCWSTAGFSRWGEDRGEITAAVLKALVRYDVEHELIPGALAYFASTKRAGRWKSTKDTAMILFALCEYLARAGYRPLEESSILVAVGGGAGRRVVFGDWRSRKIEIPGSALHHGENAIRFVNGVPGVLYRAVYRYSRAGGAIEPLDRGLAVARRFWLLGENGGRVREVRAGDTVPRGAYLASEITARYGLDQPMRYVLVTNPRPAGCEVLPQSDPRFQQSSTSFVLREDRTRAVFWHHESTGASITDRCVLHAELAGEYVVPPASVELMYEPDTRGHSGSFRFKVEG